MRQTKLNPLALAITFAIGSSFVMAEEVAPAKNSIFNESAQASSAGLLEDSSANILFRNFYMNRDFRNSSNTRSSRNGKRQSYREEWAQGFIGTYESGFTQGTVGVGFEAMAMYGFRLDSGKGRSGTGLMPLDQYGRADKDYSKIGGSVKLRVSNTVLKYGNQFVDTPVFSTDDGRLLPEIAEGFLLTSEEIKNLTLTAGHFTAITAQDQSYHDSVDNGFLYGTGSKSGRGLKRATFGGLTYQFTPDLSTTLYYSHVKDFWDKAYANINYNIPINDEQALTFDFNYYNTKSRGPVKDATRTDPTGSGHSINSHIWSLQASYAFAGAHKLSASFQRVTGHGPGNPYGVEGGGAFYVPNSVQYSDFNNEGERSWQVRYDLNMEKYGVPGLTFMTRYTQGSGIASHLRAKRTGGRVSEWEHDMEAKYVVQTGAAKDLSVRVRYATYRSSGFEDDVNDFRVITEYPWDLMSTFKKK